MTALTDFLSRPDVGSVTLGIASNGKAYVTAYLARPNGSFAQHNKWAASVDEAIEHLAALPVAAARTSEPVEAVQKRIITGRFNQPFADEEDLLV